MSKRLRAILIFFGAVIIAATLFVFFGVPALQTHQWISRPAETQTMAQLRPSAAHGIFKSFALSRDRVTHDRVTLYNALYYPEVSTAIATATMPEHFKDVAAYLVDDQGTVYAGWYDPTGGVKFGIMKLAFEHLASNQLIWLDLVDQSKVGKNGYDPATDFPDRIRFELIRIPLESIESTPSSES